MDRGLPLAVYYGITGIRDMGSTIEQVGEARVRVAKGEILSPRMYLSGPPLNGTVKRAHPQRPGREHGLVPLPVLQEALKPLPALFLPKRSEFPETVDGLVFGIAAGLGFSVAESLVAISSALPALPAHVTPGNWIYDLATLAIFQPLLQSSATGMVVAAVWRYRRGRLARREAGGVAMAVIAHVAFALGTQLLNDVAIAQLFVLVWQAVVVGSLLIYVRYLLHHALLEEAAHMGYAETICPNCHMHIVASGFCPNCGMALTAAPAAVKRARKPVAAVKYPHSSRLLMDGKPLMEATVTEARINPELAADLFKKPSE